jgi:hypothetical protein
MVSTEFAALQHKYIYKTHIGKYNMLFTSFIEYIESVFKNIKTSQTYGSELESYITSRKPQSPEDIEYLQRQFDNNIAHRNSGWKL